MTIKKNAAAAYFCRLFCISNPFNALTSFFVYFQLSIFILDDYNLLESHGPPSVPNRRPNKASVNFEGKLLEEKYMVSNFCNEILQNVQLPI